MLARHHKVTQQTISLDAKFARSVNAITDAAGIDSRHAILARDTKLGRADVHKLADIARALPQIARASWRACPVSPPIDTYAGPEPSTALF
jgi:hypothetical protein